MEYKGLKPSVTLFNPKGRILGVFPWMNVKFAQRASREARK